MGLKSRYSLFRRFDLDSLYNTFVGLTPREQMMALGVSAFLLLLVVGLPISLMSGKLSGLEKRIDQSRETQKQVLRDIEYFQKLQADMKTVEDRFSRGFDSTITTTMETLAGQAGIREQIDSLKERPPNPSDLFDENSVDVRLRKVTLPQLVDYLFKIEHHPQLLLRVKQIQIKPRYDNKQLLDVSFQVSTFRLQQGG